MKTATLTVFGIVGLAMGLVLFGSYAHTSQLFTKRAWASYKPGDCLRTPVVNSDKVERWEAKDEPDTILMVSEVGKSQYRTREWGRRFSNAPRWYDSYNTEFFSQLDDTDRWQPVACPQQGPDAEDTETDRTGSLKFKFGQNGLIYDCTSTGCTVTSQ